MKMKRTTVMGMCVAMALIIGVPALFAAGSAGAISNDHSSAQVMSKAEASSDQTKVSIDGGKTWMSELEYQKDYPASVIDWWTADEYQKWLEQEKAGLKLLVNAPGWSQERVDHAIERYEQTLDHIKHGAKISKTVDGDESAGYGDGGLGAAESNVNTVDNLSSSAEGNGIEANSASSDSSVRYSTVLSLENGDTKDLGLFATKQELNAAVKAFCEEQVKTGTMSRQEADGIINKVN